MATEPLPKKQKSQKTIGTHSGTFHCDEVLACCMLKMLPEYSNAEIIRTRDESVLNTCDIVVDVGGKYEPASHRYDHHQRSCLKLFGTLYYFIICIEYIYRLLTYLCIFLEVSLVQ